MTAAILLFTVIGLVMLTNMREQRIATRISTAVTSIYEDRLVVAQYILRLSKQMDGIIAILEKEETEVTARINSHLAEVATLTALYGKTILTEMERANFETFKQLCQTISVNNKNGDHTAALSAARNAGDTLQTLSSIQVEEGKNLLDEVLDMTRFSNMISYLELAILIVIAVIIQVLVFASKTLIGIKKPTNENLN
ncbi:MCP four helix bundle domain-containing protein [Sphingobacterium gobiense]